MSRPANTPTAPAPADPNEGLLTRQVRERDGAKRSARRVELEATARGQGLRREELAELYALRADAVEGTAEEVVYREADAPPPSERRRDTTRGGGPRLR